MGSDGPGLFQSDQASEWLDDFLDGEDDGPIYDALDRAVADPAHDLGDGGEQALVAAEVVAALLGRPAGDAPRELVQWAQGAATDGLDPELPDLARRAVRRVRDRSELRELWLGGPGVADAGADAEARAWLDNVDDLLSRLTART